MTMLRKLIVPAVIVALVVAAALVMFRAVTRRR